MFPYLFCRSTLIPYLFFLTELLSAVIQIVLLNASTVLILHLEENLVTRRRRLLSEPTFDFNPGFILLLIQTGHS